MAVSELYDAGQDIGWDLDLDEAGKETAKTR